MTTLGACAKIFPYMANKPLLIVSDSPSASSGLARIARDLSTRIHKNMSDVYRVACAGYGSPGSCKFGFPIYNLEGMSDWVLPSLPEICDDFFGKERGIVLYIWDVSRTSWISQPVMFQELTAKFPHLQQRLRNRKDRFDLWGYFPIDASGPLDRLTFPLMQTLLGFDRILAYGAFGEGVIRRTIGDDAAD